MQLITESFKTMNKLFDLGLSLSKLGIVSGQTVYYRTAFMQQGAATSRWQKKEAQTMTLEKVNAAQQGSEVIFKGWFEMNQSILQAYQKRLKRMQVVPTLTTPFDLLKGQQQWFKILEESALDTVELNNEILETLNQSLKPAYVYASGNAKRLSRKKPRQC